MDQIGANHEVLQRLTRLETKMDMIISGKEIANEAYISTKSAHKRIDELEEKSKEIPIELATIKTKVERHDQYLMWVTTSGFFSLVGIILSLYSLLTR